MSTICLCRRAGKLVIGFDAVIKELASAGSGAGVVLASDVSPKTEKEVRFRAKNTEVIRADFSMSDAEDAVGKRAGVFLVSDAGLYGSIKKHIAK